MATAPVAPLTSLPKIARERAEVGTALLRLLGRKAVQVAIVGQDACADSAFVAGNHIAFALNELPENNLDAICEAIDAADPLLSHIEKYLGLTLSPTDVRASSDTAFGHDGAYIVALALEGQSITLALIAEDEVAARWIAMADDVQINLSAIPVPATLDCIAARLPVIDVAGIGIGDLLLLPQTLASTISGATGQMIDGTFQTATGNWRAGGFDEAENSMAEDEQFNQGGFAVPVTMRLPQQSVDAATLAALAPGAIIPLSPLTQGLQVELLVGGKLIARGEIVEMGERFAVHIDESFATTAAAAATVTDQGED